MYSHVVPDAFCQFTMHLSLAGSDVCKEVAQEIVCKETYAMRSMKLVLALLACQGCQQLMHVFAAATCENFYRYSSCFV